MAEKKQAPQKQPVVIPRTEDFVESYVMAAPVNILNDGSIAIEFLKPDIALVVNEEGKAGYQGQFVSVGRFIMSPETARRLLNDLYNTLKLYEPSKGDENGE